MVVVVAVVYLLVIMLVVLVMAVAELGDNVDADEAGAVAAPDWVTAQGA